MGYASFGEFLLEKALSLPTLEPKENYEMEEIF